jgi:hypothetical protein
MNNFTDNEIKVLIYLREHKGWIAPSIIARNADKVEHCCSWASHICLRLTDKRILEQNTLRQYCYNKGTLNENRFVVPWSNTQEAKTKATPKKIIRPLNPTETEIDLKCLNGDLYTITTLENGLQIKKQSDHDEKINISTCKGDRIIIGDCILYIY